MQHINNDAAFTNIRASSNGSFRFLMATEARKLALPLETPKRCAVWMFACVTSPQRREMTEGL
jgi:hypothetical protein